MPVTLKAFQAAKDLATLQRISKEAINKAAGKGNVRFVAARNFKVGAKMTSVFLVVDKPTEFIAELKKQGGLLTVAEGTAEVAKGNENKLKIKITASRGQLSDTIVSTIIKPAMGNDSSFEGTTEAREKAEQEQQESDQRMGEKGARKPQALGMAIRSHQEAQEQGLLDWKAVFTKEVVEDMAKVSFQSAEFGKFNQNFTAFLKKCAHWARLAGGEPHRRRPGQPRSG